MAIFAASSRSGIRRASSPGYVERLQSGRGQVRLSRNPYLTITLEPAGDGVLLTLTHLPVMERFEKQTAMGWHTYLDMLSARRLKGEPVEDRPVYMQRNAALYGVDLDNLAR